MCHGPKGGNVNKQKWVVTVALLCGSVVLTACGGSPSSSSQPSAESAGQTSSTGGGEVTAPNSPAGQQLEWLINAIRGLPLSTHEISAHFDSAFLSKVSPSKVNLGLKRLDPTGAGMTVVQLTKLNPRSLEAHVQIGSKRDSVSLAVDPSGLIEGLIFSALSPSSATCAAPGASEPCYTALQLEQAYDLKPLYARGLDGSGTTIVVLAGIISPTIDHDLAVFDQAFGLRTPSIRVVSPTGQQLQFSPRSTEDLGLASEITGDVEAAHTIAPGANIVLLVAPPQAIVSNASVVNWAALAVLYTAQHQLGQVVTSSLSNVGEAGLGASNIDRLHEDYQHAASRHLSVIQASGDFGASSRGPDGGIFPERMRGYPASDPLVTAVGGTRLHLDPDGNRTSPDTVFNDTKSASGGGLSTIFSRPSYQDSVEPLVGDHRGGPDVSMSADAYGGFEWYASFDGGAGWHDGGGTSVSAPMFSGIVAIADQAAGHPLGPLNPYLYRAYQLPGHGGLVPVTSGNSTITTKSPNGSTVTIRGYRATPGYNLATGLGTVDADELVMTLAHIG
jgi:subtilase family serine protease